MREVFSKKYWMHHNRIESISSDTLFFVGFIPYLIHSMWETTMFQPIITGTIGVAFTFACSVVLLLKVLIFDEYTLHQLVVSGMILVVGMMTYYGTRDTTMLMLTILIISSKNVCFDTILKVWLVVVVCIMVIAFAASMIGIIENLQYRMIDNLTDSVVTRNSFGIVYPTDFGAHVFFCILTFFYLKRHNLKWYCYVVAFIFGIAILLLCKAKLDAISIFLLTILFFTSKAIEKNGGYNLKRNWKMFWSIIGVICMPVMAAVMFLCTKAYGTIGALDKMDRVLSYRISTGSAGLEKYGIRTFGQQIKMFGYGGSTDISPFSTAKYNFIDCSYINILVVDGIVFFLFFIVTYVAIGFMNRKNVWLMLVIVLISINGMMAHHIIEIEYCIFTLALFADMGDVINRNVF